MTGCVSAAVYVDAKIKFVIMNFMNFIFNQKSGVTFDEFIRNLDIYTLAKSLTGVCF